MDDSQDGPLSTTAGCQIVEAWAQNGHMVQSWAGQRWVLGPGYGVLYDPEKEGTPSMHIFNLSWFVGSLVRIFAHSFICSMNIYLAPFCAKHKKLTRLSPCRKGLALWSWPPTLAWPPWP